MPKTQYAKSGDLHIAYQVTGKGPFDLVLFLTHLHSITLWAFPISG